MAEGGFTDFRVEKWLSQLSQVWISLHYAHPVIDGSYASEVFGGSYSRVSANISTPSSRAVYIEQDVRFLGLPNVRVTHIGGWSAQYNGDLEFWSQLPEPKMILEGRSFVIPSSSIALSIS